MLGTMIRLGLRIGLTRGTPLGDPFRGTRLRARVWPHLISRRARLVTTGARAMTNDLRTAAA